MNAAHTPDPGAGAEGVTDAADAADASATVSVDDMPTSFGVFKPVGYVMMGLPTQRQSDALAGALQGAGWQGTAVLHFAPSETTAELEAMVDSASALAGFGYEITLLRRYLALAKNDYRWLLVKVDDGEHAAAATEVARGHGATLAIYYRTFTIEELL